MGNIEIFAYGNDHLKYHSYCKYHNTSKLVEIAHEHYYWGYIIFKMLRFYNVEDNITIVIFRY